MIQPHEPLDYHPHIGFQTSTSKPVIDNHRYINFGCNELSDWVEHITKQLIDDLPETAADNLHYNNPTTLSQENNVVQSISAKPTWRIHVDASNNDLQCNSTQLGIQTNTSHHNTDNHGLNLITLLMECAVAISVDNLGEAHRMLLELTQMVSPYGPSCAESVVAYFAKAMTSRVVNSWLGICSPLVDYKSVHCAFQVFNNISPFIKFAHFTSNQAILEAVHRCDKLHIVDLDIMQGLQWPALFHILATRVEGPPHVRMTGMGTSMEFLVETGKQLSNFAKRLGMTFEFHPLARKLGDIDVSMVQVRSGETLAVHWLQHSLYDANGPDWKTLRILEELKPRIITLVEQDVSHGGSFLDRFVGCLHYYSTLFDSLGAYLASDDTSRHHVEHSLFQREINNILAIGGPARSGEDKFRQWRSELVRNCFLQVPMSANSMAQAQLILNMFPPAHGYSLVQGDGTLRLGWKNTSLYTASAWTCNPFR
ncbi:protein SCARECROW-like [Quillaja saponaria]|uniref:Protein SCARECROW-like n=1 Tax=Quillaja saponaria TaxID=32244 RepID=A0AAD7Q993_QUISA|nr:protein SCARECROW-like [Quillaja saponaria]